MIRVLEDLLGRIEPYAVWQIRNLESIFEGYLETLETACRMLDRPADCRQLQENTGVIRRWLEESKAKQSVVAYNRAVIELTMDIEALHKLLQGNVH